MKKVLITSSTYLKFSSLPLELFKNERYEVNWIKKATHDQLLENIIDALLVIFRKSNVLLLQPASDTEKIHD